MSRGSFIMDTHVLLWSLSEPKRLKPAVAKRIDTAFAAGKIAVSTISWWEIAMLHQKRRITLQNDTVALRRELLGMGLNELPLDGSVAIAAATLQQFHGDPADRIIVASAIASAHTLITADQAILAWQGELNSLAAN